MKSYTALYTAIQRYTQLYTVIQGYAQLCRAIHSYTDIQTAIQVEYRAIHSYTETNTANNSFSGNTKIAFSFMSNGVVIFWSHLFFFFFLKYLSRRSINGS